MTDALDQIGKHVRVLPVVEAPRKLIPVERQIILADVVEAAHNAPFDQAPERLNVVRVDFAANVFTLSMMDGFMPDVAPPDGRKLGFHRLRPIRPFRR